MSQVIDFISGHLSGQFLCVEHRYMCPDGVFNSLKQRADSCPQMSGQSVLDSTADTFPPLRGKCPAVRYPEGYKKAVQSYG
jgi:hypothetical protein